MTLKTQPQNQTQNQTQTQSQTQGKTQALPEQSAQHPISSVVPGNPFAKDLVSRVLQIGPYRIRPVPTGVFGLDGGAMFGTVPKVLWEKTNPADQHNRISMEARALLLDGGEGTSRILIDCGIGGDFIAKYGEKLGSKFSEIYGIHGGARSISTGSPIGPSPIGVTVDAETAKPTPVEAFLNSIGLGAADITDVILTHLHFDHAGGATTERGGKLAPTFPNARYFIQKANLETARNPNLREKASYFRANFEPLEAAGVLQVLDGPIENLRPGVSVEITDGHTLGQQVVRVSDGDTTLLYCGDLIPTSTHVRLPWVMGYDLQPLVLIEEKRRVLSRAAREHWYLFLEHDPYMDAIRVQELNGDFAPAERVAIV